MFAHLGRSIAQRRFTVLAMSMITMVIAALYGSGVFTHLDASGGFTDPGSESVQAAQEAQERLGRTASDIVVVYRSETGRTIEDPEFAADVEQMLADLPASAVAASASFFSTGEPAFVSQDRTATFVALTMAGETEEERAEHYAAIEDQLLLTGYETLRGGPLAVGEAIGSQVEADIVRAESITLPILGLLLVVVLGSVSAALLPWLLGGVSIIGSLAALRLVTEVTDVSVFAINVITILGLGLAIDYALFVVTRFRDELGEARDRASIDAAIVTTMATAGRTVAFSGLTVAVSLSALLFFPQTFLRSMGFGSISAVLIAMIAALVILPAVLAVLGHRINSLSAGSYRGLVGGSGRFWASLGTKVMRRPGLVTAITAFILLALGAPFLGVQWGGIDARVLPKDSESRQAGEALAGDFGQTPGNTIDVLLTGATPGPEIDAYAAQLGGLDGASGATLTEFDNDETVQLSVAYDGDQITEQSEALVQAVRAEQTPEGSQALVGGAAAEHVDLLASIGERLPWAAGTVVLVTLMLLFLAFGSVVLPIKAVLMNVLSLSAVLGVLVWGFQDGNLAEALSFTSTGALEATQPILVLAIAFGLSTDYEVFLLSRVREDWERHGDNTLAVTNGLARTGGIITSAALLLGVVMSGFLFSQISFIQTIGVGLLVGLLLDAFIVRVLLVPATMRLLGGANWWAPPAMTRWWVRHNSFAERSESPAPIPAQPVGV
ncbi:MAG: MMPL family transporter [Ornithinimicrobium sp.]